MVRTILSSILFVVLSFGRFEIPKFFFKSSKLGRTFFKLQNARVSEQPSENTVVDSSLPVPKGRYLVQPKHLLVCHPRTYFMSLDK
jgi:hypothetical protein